MKRSFLKENVFVVCILLLILGFSFYDIVFLGKTLKVSTANPQSLSSGVYGQEENSPRFFPVQATEVSIYEEGVQEFIRKSFQQGILPLWNPHQGAGYPLVGMMQVGIFWPLNYFLYLLPNFIAWDLLLLSRFFFAGLFTYWFMRELRYGKTPSFGAAVTYMLSGAMVLLQVWYANVEILTPLLLLSWERLVKKPHLKSCCFAAITVALTFFAGHAEHILLIHSLGFLYFCFRLIFSRPCVNRAKSVAGFLGAYVLGLGLSAIVLFPFLQNWATEFWHTHPESIGSIIADKGKIWELLVSIVMPHFFQKEPVLLNFTRVFSGWWGYIGIFSVGLASLSLFSRQRQKLNYFFAGMLFVIIAKTYLDFPLTNWIGYLPFFKYCRFYLHSPHLFAFCFAVLTGMGIRVALSGEKAFLKGLVFSGGVLLLGGISLFHHRAAEHFSLSVKASLFGLGALLVFQVFLWARDKRFLKTQYLSGLLILLMSLEIFFYIPREHVNRVDSFPQVPYIEELRNDPEKFRAYGTMWTLYPNTASGYQIDDLGIVHGLLSKRFVSFVNHFIREDYFKKDYGGSAFWVTPFSLMLDQKPYLDLLNVKYTTTPSRLPRLLPISRHPYFPKPFYEKELKIFRRPDALPRAFVVHRVLFETEEQRIVDAVKSIKYNFSDGVVIDHEFVPEIVMALEKTPVTDGSKAEIVHYSPNQVNVKVLMEHPGFLVLGDAYHPDWMALVDGKEAEVYAANYLVRAVFVPQGQHTVEFQFRPKSFFIGRVVSLLFSGLLIVLLLRSRGQASS